MQVIKINPTKTTPAVLLDPHKGVFKLYGRSSPENSIDFYYPVKSTLSTDLRSKSLDVNIRLDYFNTSSSKCLYDLFRVIKKLRENGTEVRILWYYQPDDEDMLEVGEDYSDLLDLPFSFIEYYPCMSA